MWTRITPNTDHFYAVRIIHYFQQDYIDFLNSVQYGNQHCRFFYPFDTNEKTYIKYTTASSNPGVNSNLN